MLRFSVSSVLGLIALTSNTAAFAAVQQDTVPSDTIPLYKLEGITVTVARSRDLINQLPYAVGILGLLQIQALRPTISLDESLPDIPGVFVDNRYNFALGNRISIRGFGSRSQFGVRGIRIIQDGIPLTLPDGQSQTNNVDIGGAGRMEVIRGNASSLYGNASGGVISIQTEPAPEVPFRPEIRILGGGYGNDQFYQKYDLKGAGRSGRFDYYAHLTHFNNDGYRLHSKSEFTLLNTRVGYRINERSDLTAVVNYVNAPLNENPSSIDETDAAENPDTAFVRVLSPAECPPGTPGGRGCQNLGEESDQGQVGLTYRNRIASDHQISLMGYGTFRNLVNPIPGTLIELDRWVAGTRFEYQWSPDRRLFTGLIAGFDLDYQDDDRVETCRTDQRDPLQTACRDTLTDQPIVQLDEQEKVTGLGIFANTRWALARELELTLSARYDAVRFQVDDRLVTTENPEDSGSETLDQFSPFVGLRYTPQPWLILYGNIGRTFQTPTTTEFTDTLGGFNNDLKPERATNYEIGLKGTAADRVSYSLALFYADVEDQLIGFEANERVFFQNAGSSTHRGIEASLTALLTRGLTVLAAYTYSNFEFDTFVTDGGDFSGREIPGIPSNRFRGRLTYIHPTRLTGELQLTAADGFFVDNENANENRNDGYVTLDLRFGYSAQFSGTLFEPFIGLNNITDERYNSSVVVNAFGGRFFEPAPGRNLYAGILFRTR